MKIKYLLIAIFIFIFKITNAQLTGIKYIPTNYSTLAAAIADINSNGIGSGGLEIIINSGHTETIPNGSSGNPAGLLITAHTSISNPLSIRWSGTGTKPMFTAGTGSGNNDFILGLAGCDYVTIKGLRFQENVANTTNNSRTEIGIALFKRQAGTSTQGADGCQNNIIENCEVTLNRLGNATRLFPYTYFDIYTNTYITKNYCLQYFSKGIAMVYWDYKLNGYFNYSNISTGINSNSDLNSNNQILNNTINNCYFGIWINDHYKLNGNLQYAPYGNIIGKQSLGNIINNFGANIGTSYQSGSYNFIFSGAKGIYVGGQSNIKINYNTVDGGNSNIHGVLGIVYSNNELSEQLPKFLGKIEITNNIVRNLNAIGGSPANNNSDAIALLINSLETKSNFTDSLIIKKNIISNITSNIGTAQGICLGGKGKSESSVFNGKFDASNQSALITNNYIYKVRALGNSTTSTELVAGINFSHNYSKIIIENNRIKYASIGSLSTSPNRNSSLVGIGFKTYRTNAYRFLVNINNNIVDSCIAADNGNSKPSVKLIYVYSGGLITNIENNTIRKNMLDMASDYDFSMENTSSLLAIKSIFTAGTSTINIKNNRITNNSKNGSGARMLNGIFIENNSSATKQIIKNNLIDTLKSEGSAGSVQCLLNGIRIKGNYLLTEITIDSNQILKLSGIVKNKINIYSGDENSIGGLKGICIYNAKSIKLRKNIINDLDATSSTGYFSTQNSSITDGVYAISVHGYHKNSIYEINNNFISNLKAPNLTSRQAICGIFLNNKGKFFIDHNTIVIGDPISNTNISSTTNYSFGVSGIAYAPFNISTSRPLSNPDQYVFRNNIISINATTKSDGAAFCIRQMTSSAANTIPGDINTLSTGNLYYINSGSFNFIYGQGTIANTTGGIKNCFAYTGGSTSTTHNLVVSNDFNDNCGKYEKFMAGAEQGSYIDISAGNITQAPFIGGTTNIPNRYFLNSAITSYAFIPTKIPGIETDHLSTQRPSMKATAGAKQVNGNYGTPKKTLNISYNPIYNGMCLNNYTVVANIFPIINGVSVDNGANAPRIYYKLSTQNNLMPSSSENNNTFNGWKWANAISVNGNQYTFNLDFSKIGTVTAPSTIEYFIIAKDNAYLGSTFFSTNQAVFSSCCISNIDLYTSGGNTNNGCIPDANSCNSFQILDGSSISKSIENSLNKTIYTSNSAASINGCPGDSFTLTAHYYISTLSEVPYIDSILIESASNTSFTTNVNTFKLKDTIFSTLIPNNGIDKYFRAKLLCGGSPLSGSNTPYIRVTSSNCPTITNSFPDTSVCINTTINVPISNTNPTTTTRTYLVSDPNGYTKFTNGTSTSTSANVSIILDNLNKEGIWKKTIGVSKTTISNGGVKYDQLSSDINNQNININENEGMVLEFEKYTKLNSIVLWDDPNDATISSGFKLVLYNAITKNAIYETSSITMPSDGAIYTNSFTNWIVSPGKYILNLEGIDEEEPPIGGLVSPLSIQLPMELSNSSKILGMSSGIEINSLRPSYSYFLDWNITEYCTSNADSFEVIIKNISLYNCVNLTHFKVDKGLTTSSNYLTNWDDNGPDQRDASIVSGGPLVNSNGSNFNQNINFNGSQYLNTVNASFVNGNIGRNYFIIADPNQNTVSPILSLGTASAYAELHLGDSLIGIKYNNSIATNNSYNFNNASNKNVPKLAHWSIGYNQNFSQWKFNINGRPIINNSSNTTSQSFTNNFSGIGKNTGTTSFYNGNITEILYYPDTLSFQKRLTIMSYLALKYGLTLDQEQDNDSNSIIGTSYFNTDNEAVWNDNLSKNFKYNIFGIGRDDGLGFDQRISKSAFYDKLIISTTRNFNELNNHISRKKLLNNTYLILSDDNKSTNFNRTFKTFSNSRMNRVWRVAETNESDIVIIGISNTVTFPSGCSKALIISDDTIFNQNDKIIPLKDSLNYYFAKINFNDGDYFTFVSLPKPLIKLSENNSINIVTQNCGNGWVYYKNSSADNEYLLAINSNGNTFNPTSITVDNINNSNLKKANSTDTTQLSKRMISIVAPGTYNINGGIKVRIFFDSSDFANFPNQNRSWFKHNKHHKDSIIKDLGANYFNNAIKIFPDSIGKLDGIDYIDFKLTSFSTIGYMGSNSMSPLPVKLISFTAKAIANKSVLNWSTASEINCEKFEIQKLENKTNWITIGSVGGKGNNNNITHYQFIDHNPKNLIEYYRLIQWDYDGKDEIYGPKEVIFGKRQNTNLEVFPNPIENTEILNCKLENENISNISIININGQVLKFQENINSKYVEINIKDLTSGMYFVKCETLQKRTLIKKIIIK